MAVKVDAEHADWEIEFTNDADGSGTNVFELGGEAEGGQTFFDFTNVGGIWFSSKCYADITASGAEFTVWIDGAPASDPPSYVEDTFTDTDTTALAAHAPDVDSVGTGWADITAGITIESNKASDNDGARLSVIDAGAADITAQATMVIQGGGNGFNGLSVRYQDTTHFIIGGCDVVNDVVTIWTNNGGVWTEIGGNVNGSFNFTAGETRIVKVVTSGTTIQVYIGGTLEATGTTALFQSATKHGLYNDCAAGGTDATWDDFSIV